MDIQQEVAKVVEGKGLLIWRGFEKAIISASYVGDTNSIDMWESLWIPWVQGFKANPSSNPDLQRSL